MAEREERRLARMEHFTGSNILFTAAGAAVFWALKGGRSELKAFGLYDLVALIPVGVRLRRLLEFILFLCLGCIIGIGFTDPSNPRQALTAGFGWTGLLAMSKTGKDVQS